MSHPKITAVQAQSYTIPTDQPESDGTFQWNSTTAIVVEVKAAGHIGIGLTYTSSAAAELIRATLGSEVMGESPLQTERCFEKMWRSLRNIGRPGLGMMAISAVDFAIWDLKAKILETPMHLLLGAVREEAPIYGSGGFTSYSMQTLKDQLAGWVESGIPRVKIKIGRGHERDLERIRESRAAIGPEAALFVDANGAYTAREALAMADAFKKYNVSWYEEPVSSDDLQGLRLIRERCSPALQIAAGEYGFDETYFRRMIASGSVDVLQIDATRCGGITGFLRALNVARAFQIPVSAHCAPSMHAALGCHSDQLLHLEYFYDHIRVEETLFESATQRVAGSLRPDSGTPGFGLILKKQDVAQFAA